MAEAGSAPAEQLSQAIATSAAEAGRGRKRGMTAERVELEKSVFKQRLHDIMHWITEVLGEDVFSAAGALGVDEEWQEVQEKKLVQQQFDDNEKSVIDTLENGTVLCKLMETIVPDSCKGYVGQPKTPAACLSNIQAFIVACSHYGVEATFTSLDLFELKNLKTVVSCLNELGKRASRNGFSPAYSNFAPETRAVETDPQAPADEDRKPEAAAAGEAGDEEQACKGESEEDNGAVESKDAVQEEAEEEDAEEKDLEEEPLEDKEASQTEVAEDGEDGEKGQEAKNEEEGSEEQDKVAVDGASGETSDAVTKSETDDEAAAEAQSAAVPETAEDAGTPSSEAEDQTGESSPATSTTPAVDASDESEDYEEEYEEEIIEEIIEESSEEECEDRKEAEQAAAGDEDVNAAGDEPKAEADAETDDSSPVGPVGEAPGGEDSPQGDMMDILLGLIDDGAAPDAAPEVLADTSTRDSSSADDDVVRGDVLKPGEKPVTPTRPTNLDALLSPRKPEVPQKPLALSPKPAVPRKPEGLLSPRCKPEVPEKPAVFSEDEPSGEEASDSEDVMEGWNRDDFANKIMELRAELKRERRLREIAEKEVRKLRQDKKQLKRGAGKSLSLSSANVLKKKKARSSSVKGISAENLRMQLEEKRRQKELQEEARRELEEARKSKLSTAEQRQRLAVLHEILNTEKSYVDDLKQIQQVHTILCADDRAATPVEVQTVFSNVAQILFIHEELTSTFDERMEQCTVENAWECAVGDIFLKLGDFLKIYTVYVSNQAKQTHVVEELLHHSRFVTTLTRNMPDVFKVKQAVPTVLRSLLIKPIQRICKYPLLLRELIKSTDEAHPDKENLRKAMEHAESIAAFVNEKKKESEALMKLVHIQESVGDLPKNFKVVTPTRVFIRETYMVKISKGRAQERHFFLFNDLLLYAAKRALGGKLMFKGKVPLSTLLVNDLPDTTDRQHMFELVRLDHKKKKYIICAKSEEEKQVWMHELSDLISALLKQANNERKGIQEETTLTEHESLLASIRFTSDALDSARAAGESDERIYELEQEMLGLKKKIGTDISSQV